MTTSQATAEIGTIYAQRTAGAVVIQIVKAVDGFTVLTWAGSNMVDGWCQSYGTLTEAKVEANRARDAYRTHKRTAVIDTRRQQLIADRDQAERRHQRSHTTETRAAYRASLAEIDRELDALEDLATRALAPRLVADITRYLTNAA
jgi:hypothetical protein